MRIIDSSVEIMRTGLEKDFMSPEQFIERVGRTCYKSEDKITEDSAAKFVSNLIKRGHEAMIEHWNLIFEVDRDIYFKIKDIDDLSLCYDERNVKPFTSFFRFTEYLDDNFERRYIVSGNMRAWRDCFKAFFDRYGGIPTYYFSIVQDYPIFFPEYQDYISQFPIEIYLKPISVAELSDNERKVHQNVTMKFICDRGVSHEIVRHRVASFAQESTRYCNYGLDKFGNEITVVRPSWCEEGSYGYRTWEHGCEDAEDTYFTLIKLGHTPQEARSVLPNSLKTEIIVTMNLDGWDHFFDLRCDKAAHPDIRKVACVARDDLHAILGV